MGRLHVTISTSILVSRGVMSRRLSRSNRRNLVEQVRQYEIEKTRLSLRSRRIRFSDRGRFASTVGGTLFIATARFVRRDFTDQAYTLI